MYCPKCAVQSSDDQRFCKACGTNLVAVNQALLDPRSQLTEHEWKRRRRSGMNLSDTEFDALWRSGNNYQAAKIEKAKLQSIRMMQGGIITAFAGIGATIFMYLLFTSLAKTEPDPQGAAALRVVWTAGLVPLFIGVGILVSGLLSRTGKDQFVGETRNNILMPSNQQALPEQRVDANPISVTEHTTRHLYEEPVRSANPVRDTNEVN